MKKIIILITVLAFYFNVFGSVKIIKNQDKPLRGEWDFKPAKVWQVNSAGDDMLIECGTILVDDEGKIYFLESKQVKIFVFAPDGKFLFSFAQQGEGPGEIKNAYSGFLLDDRLIIPDFSKFHFFSGDGKYIKSINPGAMLFPMAFIDPNRFIYSLARDDSKNSPELLKVFNLDTGKSKSIAEISAAQELTASSGGMALTLKIQDIALSIKDNFIYFGKGDQYVIKKIDLDGKEILSFSLEGRKKKKISMKFKRNRLKNVKVNNRKMPDEMIDQMVKGMPDESPFFKGIMVDNNGLIYVIVGDEENVNGWELDIFSPAGQYLYHGFIRLPGNMVKRSDLIIKNNFLFVFAEDEEGERTLVKFKIGMPKN